MIATIKPLRMWQTTDLDYAIAQEFFGWRWMAYSGIPVRGTPGYPEKCKVRRFFQPSSLAHKQWIAYFAEVGGVEPANGDEPLDYSYCSSQGPARVPHYSGHSEDFDEVEQEIIRRGLWDKYEQILADQVGARNKDGGINTRRFVRAKCDQKCLAALAAIGSKFVTQEPA